MGIRSFAILLLIFSFSSINSQELLCGIAAGFPPYQYDIDGEVTGFDADIARLIFSELDVEYKFIQSEWDAVFNKLRTGNIDLIVGMEVNDIRKKFFDFSTSYYKREDVLFIREDNKEITSLEDLYFKVITGDRHSFVDLYWERTGLKDKFRIRQTDSKETSMKLLFNKKVEGVIMPRAVGLYLAKEMGLKVKVLYSPDPGSKVSVAVLKGNKELINNINEVLEHLIESGEISRIYNKWFEQ